MTTSGQKRHPIIFFFTTFAPKFFVIIFSLFSVGTRGYIVWLLAAMAVGEQAVALSTNPLRFRSAGVDVATQKYCLQWEIPNINDTAELRSFWILRLKTDQQGNVKMDTVAEAGNRTTRFVDKTAACCDPAIYTIRYVPKSGANYSSYEAPFRTMQLHPATLDTCANAIRLRWNAYQKLDEFSNPPTPVAGFESEVQYHIWAHIGGSTFVPDSVQWLANAGNANAFSLPLRDEKKFYHLYVAAVYNGGIDTSYSNLSTLFAALPLRPRYIDIDSLIGSEQGVALHFAVDAGTEYVRFAAEKSPEYNGNFHPFAELGSKLQTSIDDPQVTSSDFAFYRISAINDCGNVTASSPVATSLAARAYGSGQSNILEWNSVRYDGEAATYIALRSSPQSLVGIVGSTDSTTLNDNLALLPNEVASRICYRVEARVDKGLGRIHLVRSSEVCSVITPQAFMPNAIQLSSEATNSATGKQRNLFEPVSSFAIARYTLTISSRDGRKIYAGSEPWNGRWSNDSNQNFVPQARYIYHVKIIFANQETAEMRGAVSVIY
jgi:hypothetical protein